METAEKDTVKISWWFRLTDLLEQIKPLSHEDTYAVCDLYT